MIQDTAHPMDSSQKDTTEEKQSDLEIQKKKEEARAILIQRMATVAGYITLPVGLVYMQQPGISAVMAAIHVLGALAISSLSALNPDDPFPSCDKSIWEQSITAKFGRAYLAAGILSLSVAAGMELTADKRISHSMAKQLVQSQPSGATPLSRGQKCQVRLPDNSSPFDLIGLMYDGFDGSSAVVTVEDTNLSYTKDDASVLSGTMDVSGWRINCITGSPKALSGKISFKQTFLSNGLSRFEAK